MLNLNDFGLQVLEARASATTRFLTDLRLHKESRLGLIFVLLCLVKDFLALTVKSWGRSQWSGEQLTTIHLLQDILRCEYMLLVSWWFFMFQIYTVTKYILFMLQNRLWDKQSGLLSSIQPDALYTSSVRVLRTNHPFISVYDHGIDALTFFQCFRLHLL